MTQPDTVARRAEGGANDRFRVIAQWVSHQAGSPLAIGSAVLLVLLWLASGPLFGFSEAWQLIINTGTTIVTFLMVFLIQNAQNRDTKALHLKLDELIRGVQGARTRLVSLEQCSDQELDALDAEFRRLRRRMTDGERDESSGPDTGADSSRPAATRSSVEISSKSRMSRTSGGPA